MKELQNGINGRVSRRSQGGGKPRPYYTRLGVAFVYSRVDPGGQLGYGAMACPRAAPRAGASPAPTIHGWALRSCIVGLTLAVNLGAGRGQANL
ncbi:MAG: hypothetical protein E6I80_09760 [Chloroflexi bacterium]|nr:MAG: hypothetical protein E6I80_09760 [Chloroflexota bacterium]